MHESTCRQFFLNPNQSDHRRYEALRAVFVEGCSQKEAATTFGYTYGSMRQLVNDFRNFCVDETTATEEFFFGTGNLCGSLTVFKERTPLPIRPSRIVRRSCCLGMRKHRLAEHGRLACFCSCPSWRNWGLTNSSSRPAIQARR